MLKVENIDLLIKVLVQWGMVFIAIALVFMIIFFIGKRAKSPMSIILEHMMTNLKWAFLLAIFLMAFDVTAQGFQLKALMKYVNYGHVLVITILMLRTINQIVDSLYAWKYSQLKRKGQVATATGLNGLKHIVKMLVSLTLIINAMDQMNISYTGLLTLAGAGSLAGAFAAKDIVQNIFGGLVIFFDQPFKVGDFITSLDQKIAGTVEHIGWRVTELVNIQKEPIIVPNGAFISMVIINRSKMKSRLFNEVINLRYQDFDKVPALLEAIGVLMKEKEYVDASYQQYVHLTAFASHSIDLMVRCTFASPSRDLFLKNKEQLLLDIGRLIDQHGAGMAFPTITIEHSNQAGDQQTAG